MYLEHFGFKEFPFTLTPNLRFFCNLDAYREAMNVIMVSLLNGEGFIKITGEVGTGKTLLCRKMLNGLGDNYVTAYICSANFDTHNLQKNIASELEIPIPNDVDSYDLLNLLNNRLIDLYRDGKRVVIIVDEAHALSDQTLEGLRLLSNLETESSKLVQIILVGQPELDRRLKKNHLRQLAHRIVFSYRLPTLKNRKELSSYICSRLNSAGYSDAYDQLFTGRAIKHILKASCGIPRLVNVLCHKALLLSYGYNRDQVDLDIIKIAVADTESVDAAAKPLYFYLAKMVGTVLLVGVAIAAFGYSIFKLLEYLL